MPTPKKKRPGSMAAAVAAAWAIDSRVDPNGGAGDAGADAQALGLHRDAAEHGPDERAVPLSVDPWMEVVGDEREGEPGLLCTARVIHKR